MRLIRENPYEVAGGVTTRRSTWGGEPRRGTKCWPGPEVVLETMADLRVVCLLANNFLILKTVVMSLKKDTPLFRLTHKQKT